MCRPYGFGDAASPVEGLEHGDAIGAADDGLAVQGERSRPQLGSCAGDRRIAVGPVIAAAERWRPAEAKARLIPARWPRARVEFLTGTPSARDGRINVWSSAGTISNGATRCRAINCLHDASGLDPAASPSRGPSRRAILYPPQPTNQTVDNDCGRIEREAPASMPVMTRRNSEGSSP